MLRFLIGIALSVLLSHAHAAFTYNTDGLYGVHCSAPSDYVRMVWVRTDSCVDISSRLIESLISTEPWGNTASTGRVAYRVGGSCDASQPFMSHDSYGTTTTIQLREFREDGTSALIDLTCQMESLPYVSVTIPDVQSSDPRGLREREWLAVLAAGLIACAFALGFIGGQQR